MSHGRVLLRFLSITGTLGQRGFRVTGTWGGHYIKGGNGARILERLGHDAQQARRDVLIKRRRVYEVDVESWEGEEGVDEDQEGAEGGQGDSVASSSSSPPPPS
jgi:hypothetical protein